MTKQTDSGDIELEKQRELKREREFYGYGSSDTNPQPVDEGKIVFCADGEEGIEFYADTEQEVRIWIDDMVSENEMPDDYYYIVSMTKAELDALPEV